MAGQQISVETAFPIYRQRCTELFDENLLLRAQVAGLERRVSELEQQASAQEAAAVGPEPAFGAPDLAAQPPFLEDEQA
ncbi:hypothetical protein ACFCYX_19600 [Streptomyces populi]|uniref:hypothetical protein n=1 Tax=Streptomyces populi TaxID=2058924 RepID=UPI0035D8B923